VRKLFQLICAAMLILGVPAMAMAGGRISGHNGDALSKTQVAAAEAVAMTKAEVEAFISGHNGRLQGDIGPWKDSLRLFDDKAVKGATRSACAVADSSTSKMASSPSSVDYWGRLSSGMGCPSSGSLAHAAPVIFC